MMTALNLYCFWMSLFECSLFSLQFLLCLLRLMSTVEISLTNLPHRNQSDRGEEGGRERRKEKCHHFSEFSLGHFSCFYFYKKHIHSIAIWLRCIKIKQQNGIEKKMKKNKILWWALSRARISNDKWHIYQTWHWFHS